MSGWLARIAARAAGDGGGRIANGMPGVASADVMGWAGEVAVEAVVPPPAPLPPPAVQAADGATLARTAASAAPAAAAIVMPAATVADDSGLPRHAPALAAPPGAVTVSPQGPAEPDPPLPHPPAQPDPPVVPIRVVPVPVAPVPVVPVVPVEVRASPEPPLPMAAPAPPSPAAATPAERFVRADNAVAAAASLLPAAVPASAPGPQFSIGRIEIVVAPPPVAAPSPVPTPSPPAGTRGFAAYARLRRGGEH